MAVCYLGIGSNLGNRKKNISRALDKLKVLKGTKIVKLSGIIETLPVGGPNSQGKFLNACLKIETELSPIKLLKKLKDIERSLGRAKTVRFGPRPIDLDILLYANTIINRANLKVPHPRMLERSFVLQPLAEVL